MFSSFETKEYLGVKRTIKDKERSKKIRLHEEQHQFNKLFDPKSDTAYDTPYFEFKRLDAYAKAHPEQNVTALFAKKFAQIMRQLYIDTRARDEIIAYTRDGRSAEEIFVTLSKNGLYDFKNDEVNLTTGEKTDYKKLILRNTRALTKRLLETGKTFYKWDKGGFIVEVGTKKPWAPEDEVFVDMQTNAVLGAEYQRKLRRWTNLVKYMKEAGYETREIVPFLSMLPINRWHSSVRRLLRSKQLRPIDRAKLSISEAPAAGA